MQVRTRIFIKERAGYGRLAQKSAPRGWQRLLGWYCEGRGRDMADQRNSIERMISAERIAQRVGELADQIYQDVPTDALIAICVLKGSMIFYADLVRAYPQCVYFDYMAVSSYGSQREAGALQVHVDLSTDIKGKDVLIVEDIVDSGRTIAHLREMLSARGARTLRVVTLLDKPSRREVTVKIDYVGFEIPNEFVVGYGLDFDQKYRELPFVGRIPPEH